jgi:hypothetical protein
MYFCGMMRKVAGLCMLLLYLSTTAGFAMNLHFCGIKVLQVSLASASKTCCNKLAAKPMNCCHDKNLKIKVSDKHKPAAEPIKVQPTGLDIFFQAVDYFGPFNLLRPKNNAAYDRGPPTSQNASIIILYRSFRI